MMIRNSPFIAPLAALLIAVGACGTLAQDHAPVLPDVRVISPVAVIHQNEAAILTTSPTFVIRGTYADAAEDVWHFRTLLRRALLPDGSYADTRIDFQNHAGLLVDYADSLWTGWQTWDLGNDEVTVQFPDLPVDDQHGERIAYILAAQIMASDGTVSATREYGWDVVNFHVSDDLSPRLVLQHPLAGTWSVSGEDAQAALDLLPGLEGEFTWQAFAGDYGGEVVSYRWGWDVLDADDPADPGWALPPGLTDAHRRSGPLPFASGIHSLTVDVRDDGGNRTLMRLLLSLILVPDLPDQLPVLLVDDVNDRNSSAWPAADGTRLDRDQYRDAFWLDVLDGAGGVIGFDPVRDVMDTEVEAVGPRDLVAYRAVVWSGRWTSRPNSQASQLRPQAPHGMVQVDYHWLGAYQESVGHLLQAGGRAAMDHLPESPYVVPVVLDSDQGGTAGMSYLPGVGDVRVGFGVAPDGQPIHPRLYPYRNLGLAAVDVMSPPAAYYLESGLLARIARRSAAVSTKALVLDPAFAAAHMPGGPAFADTIATEPAIDWWDDAFAPMPGGQPASDVLAVNYVWSQDEFYDADIADRTVPIVPQDCGGTACVEPLFRTVSRFDWIRSARQAADPDDTWPEGYYGDAGQPDLVALAGIAALNQDRTSARTHDRVTGFVTHRNTGDHPDDAGDVILGFDPYRFDHDAMAGALQWILGEHFGLATRSR